MWVDKHTIFRNCGVLCLCQGIVSRRPNDHLYCECSAVAPRARAYVQRGISAARFVLLFLPFF